MADFNTSKVDGNTVDASEWNQLASIDNFISTSGQTPSTTNLNQTGIAAARYSSGGQFYTDSGIANAYVLSPVSPFKSPVSSGSGEGYFVGMIIRFRAGNANTGASTVNVNSAGVKNLKQADGTTDLAAGDIPTTQDSIFRYNGTSFILQKSFVAFRAFRDTSTQTIAASTATKAQLNAETFDTNGYFDSVTNYRFTPLIAGYYQFFGTCSITSVTGNRMEAMIYKNGSKVASGSGVGIAGLTSDMISNVSDLIYMNGSTDYVELYVVQYSADGNESLQNGSASTFFSGNLIS